VCGVLQSKSDTGPDDVAGVLMGVVMVWTSFWSFKFCNISLFIEIIFSNQEVLKNKNKQLICEKNTWKSGMDWVGLYLLLHPLLWLYLLCLTFVMLWWYFLLFWKIYWMCVIS
jgi:hypothetical protein